MIITAFLICMTFAVVALCAPRLFVVAFYLWLFIEAIWHILGRKPFSLRVKIMIAVGFFVYLIILN